MQKTTAKRSSKLFLWSIVCVTVKRGQTTVNDFKRSPVTFSLKIVYFDTRGQNGRLAHCKCKNAAWPKSSACGLMYRTIFFFTNSCEPAHRLQTSKMRRNSTLLDSCQYDDINIVTVSVARRR